MHPRFFIRILFYPLLSVCLLFPLLLPVSGEGYGEHILAETADAGADYLSRLYFFGESTTAHLARRGGVLDNDNDRYRVWKDSSGTRRLDLRTKDSPVECRLSTGETVTLPFREAVKEVHPPYLVLSFGLNGIQTFLRHPERYTEAYTALILAVKEASPETGVILQSVYPVCRADAFSLSVEELNQGIRILNDRTRALANEFENVRYVDTASVLSDEQGALRPEFDNSGDGIHLTNEGYRQILWYLRTHAWEETE